ncbi:hypothetical protein BN2497_14443 [Janthinobacterium sp. CG23_2]|nr:hypothetical protein BN2497_14443 [Janthinobacterium sp. CG23_2]CUU33619.1 hypothetical protein BN3177_14443 [Janthinobacterium sp. CG23_2]
MTVRLLCAYSIYPANAIVVFDAGTEAGLVAAKMASIDVTGGTPYVPPAAISAKPITVSIDIDGRTKRYAMPSTKGAQKWFGSAIAGITYGGLVANASAYRATYGLLLVAEAPFYAFQLVYVNLANNAISGMRFIAGVTESAATNVTANLCKPVIGGVTYGVMAPAGSVLGFFPVTWGGQATLSAAASVTTSQVVISDIVPAGSVPRVDVPGGFPAIVIRADHDPATGGRFTFVNTPASMRTPNAANRGRIVQTFQYGADAVTNPNINMGFSGETHLIFPIFHYSMPSLTVGISIDSTGQNDAIVADVFTSWGYRGCADASSPARPVNYVNLGCSSKGAPEFWARTMEMILAGVPINTLLFAPASVNDDYTIATLPRKFAAHRARALEAIRFCEDHNIKNLCFLKLLPFNDNNAVQDGYRTTFNAWLDTIPGVSTLAFPELGNGAVPERWVPTMNFNDDGLHPSNFAIETVKARRLTNYLNSLV